MNFDNMIPGTELTPEDQRHVFAAYVHRFTRDHRPTWAGKPWKGGRPYPLQFDSDADWLANTRFSVLKSGRLDGRCNECYSEPTWPDSPELQPPQAQSPVVSDAVKL